MSTGYICFIPIRARALAERHGRVFCLGLAVQDIILFVPEIPRDPVKTHATGRSEVGGGPAANAGVAISRLGGEARLAARLGKDLIGQSLRRELSAEGVDVTQVRLFDDRQSPVSMILSEDGGERLIVADTDKGLPPDPGWLDLSDLGEAVLADTSWPEATARLFDEARRKAVPSVLDADVSRSGPDTIRALVAAADYVVFSRPGLKQLVGDGDAGDGLAHLTGPHHRLIGVTDGPRGLFWRRDGALVQSRPPVVNAVDTLGAGDVFHGALALAIARSWPLERAIEFANLAAALKCAAPGGRQGFPRAAALKEFEAISAKPQSGREA